MSATGSVADLDALLDEAYRDGATAMREAVALRAHRHEEFHGKPGSAPPFKDVVLAMPLPARPRVPPAVTVEES